MAVDDGQRRAELMRRHRHEVALQLRQALLFGKLLLEHRRLLRQRAATEGEVNGVVAEDDSGTRHFADLVAALGAVYLDPHFVGGEAIEAAGKIEHRFRNGAPDVADRAGHHQRRDGDGGADQPARGLIGELGPAARLAGGSHRAVGETAERIAGVGIGRPRCGPVKRDRVATEARRRERDDAIDGLSVFLPPRLKVRVKRVFRAVMSEALVVERRARNRAVELSHFAPGLGGLARADAEEHRALGRAEVGGEVVEIAEKPRTLEPAAADLGRDAVDVAQCRDAESAQQHDECQKEAEDDRQSDSDRAGVIHRSRRSSRGNNPSAKAPHGKPETSASAPASKQRAPCDK